MNRIQTISLCHPTKRTRTRPTLLTIAVVGATLLAATGCASNQARVSGSWEDPDYKRQRFNRFLVVGIAESYSVRRNFEGSLAQTLSSTSTEALASSRFMESSTPLNEETIRPVVQGQQADAVIVTQLKSQVIIPDEVEGRTDVQVQKRPNTNLYEFFAYDYPEKEEPGYLRAKVNLTLSTDVYETSNGSLIYNIQSEVKSVAFDQRYDYDLIADISKAITKKLRADGLAR